MNVRQSVIKVETVFIGSLNASTVHPREIFKAAIRASAAGIIVVHNHPSGEPTPSTDDIKLTRQLVAAAEVIQIPVQDHIIVGKGRYTSMKEAGII